MDLHAQSMEPLRQRPRLRICTLLDAWLGLEARRLWRLATRHPDREWRDDDVWAWAAVAIRVWRASAPVPPELRRGRRRLREAALRAHRRLTPSTTVMTLREEYAAFNERGQPEDMSWHDHALQHLFFAGSLQRSMVQDATAVISALRAWRDWVFIGARRWAAFVDRLRDLPIPAAVRRIIAAFLHAQGI